MVVEHRAGHDEFHVDGLRNAGRRDDDLAVNGGRGGLWNIQAEPQGLQFPFLDTDRLDQRLAEEVRAAEVEATDAGEILVTHADRSGRGLRRKKAELKHVELAGLDRTGEGPRM